MDPTMQSPVRLSLPAPLDPEVPSGPHFYPIKTWIGSVAQGNTLRQAYEALLRHATPFQHETSVDGGEIDIPVVGRVRQLVDPDRLTVVNTTLPGHRLYPGNVHRSIAQEGDDFYVVTHGYGTGVLPWVNEKSADIGWLEPDYKIRHELKPYELNPYRPLGYPMDEMNAVASAAAPLMSSRAQNDRPLGLVSNEPMDFSVNQPPIFFR